jgi:very-short-patch-repair endonuclease
VFGDREFALASGVRHLSNLAQRVGGRAAAAPDGELFESPWEKQLYEAMVKRGLSPVPQFPLAGRRLDLALPRDKIDIEVDGDRYHRDSSGYRKTTDLWRDHQITGLGWRVMRFWVYELREDMDGCIDRIVTAGAERIRA